MRCLLATWTSDLRSDRLVRNRTEVGNAQEVECGHIDDVGEASDRAEFRKFIAQSADIHGESVTLARLASVP